MNDIWRNWLGLSLLAFIFSLAHLLIDFQVGVFGPDSSIVSPRQALNMGLLALSYALWAYALIAAKEGGKAGLITAIIFSGLQVAILTGLFGLIVVPPSAPAFPYQDITHILTLVFGTLAAIASWKQLRRAEGRVSYDLPMLTIVVMVANAIVAVPLLQ